MDKKHYEVVAAVIKKDNRVFCCQRGPKGECAYKWEFPGGKIEPGETREEALIREIKEELNCSIKVNQYITTVEHEYNTFSLTMHVYLCELVESEPTLLEHKSSSWCTKEELEEIDFAEADCKFLDIIKKLLDALRDIDELNRALNDGIYFFNNSVKIYNKIYNNIYYKVYISIMKIKKSMNGNQSFNSLKYVEKCKVFKMLIESIELYILQEIVENHNKIA